jgi:hypothetical protein
MGKFDPGSAFRTSAMDRARGLSDHPRLAGRETVMDVSEWLRGLDLGQYEALFRQNDIDADVLSELTESDFAQLGISLGHRKRLLRAIAALATPPVISTAPGATKPPQASTV